MSGNDGRRRPRRGEIWLVALGAAGKGEIGKTRPTLVISIDDLRTGGPYDRITVVPFTTNPRQRPTYLQPLAPAGNGLARPSVVLCDAPRAIGHSRFRQCLGSVPDDLLNQVIEARAVIEGWDD